MPRWIAPPSSPCLTSRLLSPYGITATPVPRFSSGGRLAIRSPTVSAKPSMPPAAHCRSLKSCACSMATWRPTVSTLPSKHSSPSVPSTCKASAPGGDPLPGGRPPPRTNTRKMRILLRTTRIRQKRNKGAGLLSLLSLFSQNFIWRDPTNDRSRFLHPVSDLTTPDRLSGSGCHNAVTGLLYLILHDHLAPAIRGRKQHAGFS